MGVHSPFPGVWAQVWLTVEDLEADLYNLRAEWFKFFQLVSTIDQVFLLSFPGKMCMKMLVSELIRCSHSYCTWSRDRRASTSSASVAEKAIGPMVHNNHSIAPRYVTAELICSSHKCSRCYQCEVAGPLCGLLPKQWVKPRWCIQHFSQIRRYRMLFFHSSGCSWIQIHNLCCKKVQEI